MEKHTKSFRQVGVWMMNLAMGVNLLMGLLPAVAMAQTPKTEQVRINEKFSQYKDKISNIDPNNLKSENFGKNIFGAMNYNKGNLKVSIDKNNKINVAVTDKANYKIALSPEMSKLTPNFVNGQVVYQGKDYNMMIQGVDGGVRQVLNIEKPTSGVSEYRFSLDVPNGYQLKMIDEKNNIVGIVDEKGTTHTGILPAWAKDNKGNSLKTWYSIEGNILIQHIDFANATFPVNADPTFCSSYTNSVWSEWRGGYDTVRVSPTGCARVNARFDWSGSFNEVVRKSGRQFGGSTYESLFWQWGCHADYAGIFPGTWDLETTRPNVGYWSTVTQRCNPR